MVKQSLNFFSYSFLAYRLLHRNKETSACHLYPKRRFLLFQTSIISEGWKKRLKVRDMSISRTIIILDFCDRASEFAKLFQLFISEVTIIYILYVWLQQWNWNNNNGTATMVPCLCEC